MKLKENVEISSEQAEKIIKGIKEKNECPILYAKSILSISESEAKEVVGLCHGDGCKICREVRAIEIKDKYLNSTHVRYKL